MAKKKRSETLVCGCRKINKKIKSLNNTVTGGRCECTTRDTASGSFKKSGKGIISKKYDVISMGMDSSL